MPTFITSDDISISYTDWGALDAKPIVFTHSWALNGDAWDYVVADLLDGQHRCVTYDRRGHGRSGTAGYGYEFDRLAADLGELIELLDLRDITLVGHSMGCGELTRYLTNHGDDRVARVVLVSPLLPFLLQTDDNPVGVPLEYVEASANALRNDVPQWCENNAAPYFGVNPTVSTGLTDWTARQIISTPVKALYDTMLLGATTDFRAEVAKVAKPTLVLHGDADASTPLELTGRPTTELVAGGELRVYPGAGHGIYASHHRELAADITDFIART